MAKLTLAADHIFHIGSSHLRSGLPCQDYALSGVLDGAAYAVVSDGCSSARNLAHNGIEIPAKTDIGSRMVCLSAAQGITDQWMLSRKPNNVLAVDIQQKMMLSEVQNFMGLTPSDMLATSLYALVSTEQGALVHLRGDGVIATLDNNGLLTVLRVEWNKNAPFYPAYNKQGLANFIAYHGGDLNQDVVSWQKWQGTDAASLQQVASGNLTLGQGLLGYTLTMPAEEVANLRYVAVFTDGVMQVKNVPWQQAALDLLAFKSPAGEFAKRRMNAFLRDAKSLGSGPEDDIGYAVIHITQAEEEA